LVVNGLSVYQITALAVVIAFYGAYISKNLSLKINGVSANRLVRGNKPKKTFIIELVLSIATLGVALAQAVSMLGWIPSFNDIGWLIIAGLLISALGTAVFITAMLTMRLNWRAGVDSEQSTELVIQGIYKYSRNPAFLGFDLFYIGLAAAFPNVLHIAVTLFCIIMFHFQILEEERFLEERFRDQYRAYMKVTKRYLGMNKQI